MASTKTKQQNQPHSRPTMTREVTFKTGHMQKLYTRSFGVSASSLFNIDVILPIVGDEEAIEQIEEIIYTYFDETTKALSEGVERFRTLIEQNAIAAELDYSHVETYAVKIPTPNASKLLNLFVTCDELLCLLDTLWFGGIVDSKHRRQEGYEWLRQVKRLCGKIIGIERRARSAAYKNNDNNDADIPEPPAGSEELEKEAEIDSEKNIEAPTATETPEAA